MIIKSFLATFVFVLFMNQIEGQESSQAIQPSGQPFIEVFTNYHSTFSDGKTHNAFEIQRAYFGYAFVLNERFSGKVNLDVGNPGSGSLKMTAHLKNAYFQYSQDHLAVKFGLVGMKQFELQEKQWGGRYLFKSFQDEYKYGPSADLAVSISYEITHMISMDATISNGDGYKSLEVDSVLKYSAGITLAPLKGLNVRVYYDYMGNQYAQQTISLYMGYSTDKIALGAELNRQLNHKMNINNDLIGFSFYGSYKFEKMRLFGRFDHLSSVKIGNAPNPWNYGNDGNALITGIEFHPVKGLKITPNYEAWFPVNGNPAIHGAYLSCEIKF